MGTVFQGWEIEKYIGGGAFGKVYRIVREDFGHTYEAAMKVIEIPQNPTEVIALRNDGMTEENVTEYFYGMVEEIVEEFVLMSKLKGNSNIVSYEDHAVIKKKDSFGWVIYIRMELLTPLFSYIKENNLTIKDVIQLGIDMCHALEVCQKFNIIHRDIKPENIFVSKTGDFKLGDFGIARELEKTSSELSKKGTKSYMAPEVFKGLSYNSNVDVYSLGIVLYRFLNNNRLPFMPPVPKPIRYSDKERADALRMSGQPMPKPAQANGRLAEIILKACAYMPKERYESAHAMRMALEEMIYSEAERQIIYPEGDVLDNAKAEYVLENVHLGKNEKIPDAGAKQEDGTVYLFKKDNKDIISVGEEKKQSNKNIPSENQLNTLSQKEGREGIADRKNKESRRIARNFKKQHKKKIVWAALGVCTVIFLIAFCFLNFQGRNEKRQVLQAVETESGESKQNGTSTKLTRTKKLEIKKIVVPDFSGLTKNAAKKLAAAHKLTVKTAKKEYSDTVKKGTIIGQNPQKDAKAEEGTVVSLIYSRGVEKKSVPPVIGLSEKRAGSLIKKSKLKYRASREYSNYVPNGYVIMQSIKSGRKVTKGTVILLTISRGKKPIQRTPVPNYTYQATRRPVVTRRPVATRKPVVTRKPVITKKPADQKPVKDDFDLSEW